MHNDCVVSQQTDRVIWLALMNETHVWLRAVHGITMVRRGLRLALFVGNQKGKGRNTQNG